MMKHLAIFASCIFLGACTLTNAPAPRQPTNVSNISTAESAPESVLTPQIFQTPATQAIPTVDVRVCRAINENVLAIRTFPNILAQETTILPANTTSPIIGRTGTNSWWLVRFNNTEGWADAVALDVLGDCSAIPVINTATATPS